MNISDTSLNRNLFLRFFPYFFIICIFLVFLNNLFYGYGWSDEAFYLSSVHRLFNGERLFIDDWSPTQTYVPLLYPFYAFYMKLNKSTEGIYLFFRIITLLFQTITACTAYCILSQKNSKSVSLFFSVMLIAFIRAGIPGPSYYTLCLMNFSLGILFIYAVFENHEKMFLMFFAGIFLAFAVLCNPYLAFPYIAFSLLALLIPKTRKHWKLFLFCYAGTALSAAIYTVLFIPFNHIDEFFSSIKFIFNDPAYGRSAIHTIKRLYKMPRLIIFPYILTYAPMAAALLIIKIKKIPPSQRQHIFLFILNTVLLAVNFCIVRKTIEAAVMALPFYAFFALASCERLSIQTLAKYKKEIIFSIIPGLVLSYFFCLASDTGFGICGIGIAFASFGLFSIIRRCYAFKRLFIIPLAAIFFFTAFFRITVPYRDAPDFHLLFIPKTSRNSEKITEGSAKGLYTTKENKKSYERVLAAMQALPCKNGDGLLISQLIPWAYIERKEIRCAAPTTWRLFLEDYRIKPYFTDFPAHRFPKFVLVVDRNIRDNNDVFFPDAHSENSSWLISQLKKRNYKSVKVPCGVLYMAP